MRFKSRQKGFALVAALLANLILLAVGIIAAQSRDAGSHGSA